LFGLEQSQQGAVFGVVSNPSGEPCLIVVAWRQREAVDPTVCDHLVG